MNLDSCSVVAAVTYVHILVFFLESLSLETHPQSISAWKRYGVHNYSIRAYHGRPTRRPKTKILEAEVDLRLDLGNELLVAVGITSFFFNRKVPMNRVIT